MNLKDATVIGIDTETSGKYPLYAEFCELAAVKYSHGKVVDRFQTLVKPKQQMTDFVIGIHGITNQMVESAPPIADVIESFYDFIKDDYLVAHHAPFDLGFLSIEFERKGLKLPIKNVICSSLLSRQVVTNVPNHKLQTLIPKLNLHQGAAHRALDDSQACLELYLHCAKEINAESINDIFEKQGGGLSWERFSLESLKNKREYTSYLIEAIETAQPVEIIYNGGRNKRKPRKVWPKGIIRSLNGDFFVCDSETENMKRFQFSRLERVSPILNF